MLPMKEAEVFNDDADDDMMHTIRTGQIPDQLLQDILEEAGQFMYLFKHNPSRFLSRLTQHQCPNISTLSILCINIVRSQRGRDLSRKRGRRVL